MAAPAFRCDTIIENYSNGEYFFIFTLLGKRMRYFTIAQDYIGFVP
jgi:hypothetical protein